MKNKDPEAEKSSKNRVLTSVLSPQLSKTDIRKSRKWRNPSNSQSQSKQLKNTTPWQATPLGCSTRVTWIRGKGKQERERMWRGAGGALIKSKGPMTAIKALLLPSSSGMDIKAQWELEKQKDLSSTLGYFSSFSVSFKILTQNI